MGCGASSKEKDNKGKAKGEPEAKKEEAKKQEAKKEEAAGASAASHGTEEKEVLWIAGYPGSGKTFAGDYLATRGWFHVDGDQGNQSEDKEVREKMAKMMEGLQIAQSGGEIGPEIWQPYYGDVILHAVKEALKEHNKVVVSYAIMGLFKGEKEFVRAAFPNMKFVYLKCDEDIVVDRFFKRNKEEAPAMGLTIDESWQHDYMAEARAKYGEEYSEERYKAWAKAYLFGVPMVTLTHDPADHCYVVSNDDIENNQGIVELNKVLGLDDVAVDKEAIADVNRERMKNIKVDEWNEDEKERQEKKEGEKEEEKEEEKKEEEKKEEEKKEEDKEDEKKEEEKKEEEKKEDEKEEKEEDKEDKKEEDKEDKKEDKEEEKEEKKEDKEEEKEDKKEEKEEEKEDKKEEKEDKKEDKEEEKEEKKEEEKEESM